jgi:hypothetical protein
LWRFVSYQPWDQEAMISISSLFRRILLRKSRRCGPRSDDDQLRLLHRRLIRALGESESKELVEILAEDAQLRLHCRVYDGRTNMLFALGNWLGVMQIVGGPEQVRLLAPDVALICAEWALSCPDRGDFAEQVTCLCIRRAGQWCIVQLRQEYAYG